MSSAAAPLADDLEPLAPPARHRGTAWGARLAFRLLLVVVALLGVWLAAGNNLPGHWDAINNLATGRNIAEGRGYVSDFVQQLATVERIPGPETVRAPGVPYVVAAAFRVFGVSYAVPVLLATAVVLLTALCVRQAIRESGGGWIADALGAFVLLSHATFELRSLWNNGFLALLTALLILVAVRHVNGRLTGWRLVVACGTIAAAGFLMKQTFMLGALPFGVGLLVTDSRYALRTRVLQAVAFVALFAALTAPYWVTNLVQFGHALYSPIQGLRLPTRYGVLPVDRFHRTVGFGGDAYTYATIVREIGIRELLARELAHWWTLVRAIVAQNPVIVLAAIVGLAFARRANWRMYAALLCLAIPPVFDSSYWIMERRYLFALFPISLFLCWIGIRSWREVRFERPHPAGDAVARDRRVRWLTRTAVAIAVLWAAIPAARQWRWELIASRFAQPSWVQAVAALPRDAVVMAGYPPEVNWYTRRRVVIAPLGTRAQLLQVLDRYHPQYFLDMEPEDELRRVPFAPGDLTPIAEGEGWQLHAITVADLTTPGRDARAGR